MKKNKILALVLTAALSLGLLAGCGGNTASAEKPDSTPTEASSKAPEQQTEAPEVSAQACHCLPCPEPAAGAFSRT